nr:hypothetical protein CFP56_63841 [Quercus suber]
MFMKVASIVAEIHLNGQCAGNLINRLRIYEDLFVSFPFPNKSTDGDTTFVDGIFTELHFRQMVAEVIISTIPNFDVEIPFYVKLFFSEIFLRHPEKYAYLQLMHPVFYDANQRCAFFQLNKEYVEENSVAGDALHLLGDVQFPFHAWSRRFLGNQGSIKKELFRRLYWHNPSTYKHDISSTLPIYMRNFQYHCWTKNILFVWFKVVLVTGFD